MTTNRYGYKNIRIGFYTYVLENERLAKLQPELGFPYISQKPSLEEGLEKFYKYKEKKTNE